MNEQFLLLGGGFLPTRGSWMLDFVTVAMLMISIVMIVSVVLVRYQRKKALHRKIQIMTVVLLTVALVAFEIDVRFFTDWRALAQPSPYYESGVAGWCLFIHLCFAIPTPIVWGIVIAMALRAYRTSFDQPSFNRNHRISGRIAVGMMIATTVTGWIFYYVAFVAS